MTACVGLLVAGVLATLAALVVIYLKGGEDTKFLCPHCDTAMDPNYTIETDEHGVERLSGVVVHRCPNCRYTQVRDEADPLP